MITCSRTRRAWRRAGPMPEDELEDVVWKDRVESIQAQIHLTFLFFEKFYTCIHIVVV